MPRTFLAINLTSTSRDKIATQVKSSLLGWQDVIRPVDPAIYHVTLAFLGSLHEKEFMSLEKAIKSLSRLPHPFSVDIVGCNVFPHFHAPKVLWTAFAEHPSLYTLHRSVLSSLESLGLETQTPHGFKPHITLARFKKPFTPKQKQELKEFLNHQRDVLFDTMSIDHFSLMQSTLTSSALCTK